MFRVFVVLISCVVYTYIECKVCQSMDIRNSVTNLAKLRNCTEIAGYLRIVLIEKVRESDFEDYVFPELTHITGYLLFFDVVRLTSVGQLFPNLRVIRGRELFLNAVFVLHHMPDLREIGTENLMFIGKGLVIFDRVPLLCFARTIDWKRIGASASFIYDHSKECDPCPRQCGEYCWNTFKCQEMDTNKCHQECLGCKKYGSSRDCLACKNYDDHGECVSKCPKNKVVHSSYNKCITEEECRNNLDGTVKGNWFVFNNICVNDCPQKYRKEIQSNMTTCIFCGDICSKHCVVNESLESMGDIEKIHGCTHIEGSIVLRYGGMGAHELEEYFSSVKYIRDGLVIARSQYIRTLNFLKNLTEIEGRNLDNRYAILMYENQNLERLWNISNPNFKLKIRNGTIGFHNNPLLCLSEITQFAKAVQMVYNETDVSRNSNGDKASCSTIDLHVNITSLTSRSATLSWQSPKCEGICIGYTVFYKLSFSKDGSKFSSKDVCLENQWVSIFTSGTKITLNELLPYEEYAYYIKFYQSSGLPGSETNLSYFITLPDSPPPPPNLIAVGLTPSIIQLQWNESIRHGKLSHYRLKYFMDTSYITTVELRDYCLNPRTIEGETIDRDSKNFPNIRDNEAETLPNKYCSCKRVQESFPDLAFFGFDRVYQSCDHDAVSKYGVDQCQSLEYEVLNNTKTKFSVSKRNGNGSKRFFNQKTFFEKIPAGGVTIYNITNLNHFTTYVFYLSACNFFNETEKTFNCSGYEYTFGRTLAKLDADDITNITVRVNNADVRIDWAEPKDPNFKTLSYTIVYSKEAAYSNQFRHCVSTNKNFNGSFYLLSNLNPGKYSIKVQSESLAGFGRYSRMLHFEIHYPENETSSVVISITVTVLCILTVMLLFWVWYRKKQQLENLHLIATINPDYDATIYMADEWETDRNDIEIQNDLGHGTFGIVSRGRIKSTNIQCAIKTINENRSLHERMEFLNEASVMKAFSNCNHVVKLLGVVSKGEPPLVIMELMELGDLKKFLHRIRNSHSLSYKEIYRMAIEIADGMAYLAAKKFVHRDLAARNCMVARDRTVKIGDFGMARDVYETDYYKKESKGLLPVRWMAPESLGDGIFTSDSDVWSYGIVLWEIATLAEQPYQGLSNEEVLRFVVSKGRLERPNGCSDILFEIMKSCWNWRPNDRPTFWNIVERLETLVENNFKIVSFVYSSEGIEHKAIREKQRVYNPPTLSMCPNEALLAKYSRTNDDIRTSSHGTTYFHSVENQSH